MQLTGLQERDAPLTDARQLRSRNALTAALLELLDDQPFDQITIRQITARAGTGYATFFRHYPTKEALLGDIAAREIADLLAMTTPILLDADSVESTRALCAFVGSHRRLWTALLTGGAAGIVREEFVRQARRIPRDVPPPPGWLPPDLAVVHGAGGTIDLLAWWLSDAGEDHSADQIAAILNRLIVAPLVGGEAR
jgi:AcrR family transcriptional regulator